MSSLSNILLDKEILLESGTNELELLVFDVADYTFGINVAKVREVLPKPEITGLPRAHSSIRGVFKLRDNVIPCVSLLDHLGIASTREKPESNLILTDFNQQQTAFLVDDVERIHRLSWENILAVPGLEALLHTPVTALARCDNRLIVMLDFEMILDDVTEQYFRTDAVENPLGLPREKLKILLAEDSPTVREAVGNTLRSSGYTQLLFFDNGAEAWDFMERTMAGDGRIEDVCDLVISDVEMPQVDGFHLTKKIKAHPELKQLPVLLYSSIVTPDNRKKGNSVGADAQVSKPELTEVVHLADELITTARRELRAAALREVTGVAEALTESAPSQQTPSQQTPPQPATSQPATSQPTTSQPTTSQPTTSQPATSQPATSPPTTSQPATSQPATSQPATSPPATTPSATTPSATTQPVTVAEQPAPPSFEQPSEVPQPGAEPQGDVPCPEGIDAKLWRTFQRELIGRTTHLRELLDRSGGGDHGDDLFREIARTLHTVKSASMVIPLDPVTACTHLAESLLEKAREDRDKWPQEGLQRYLAWLETLLAPPDGILAALAASSKLEAELTGWQPAER